MIKLDSIKILDLLRPASVTPRDIWEHMGLPDQGGTQLWARIQAGRHVRDRTAQSIATAIEGLIGRSISLADLRPAPTNGVPAK